MPTQVTENKLQNNIVFLFLGVFICAIIGFHKTYTIQFPEFKGFQWEQHFHGAMLMSWFALLILQPLLIRFNKNGLHRAIGKLGYVVAPLVCYSIFMVTRMTYYRDISTVPRPAILGHLALDIPTIFIFGLFFALAMINRKDSAVHMRYMIATSLMMIGPGLGRALIIFGGVPFPISIQIVYSIGELIALIFLITDIRKGKNFKPFLTILIVLLLNHVIWQFQMAGWWQAFAGWFVGLAF